MTHIDIIYIIYIVDLIFISANYKKKKKKKKATWYEYNILIVELIVFKYVR